MSLKPASAEEIIFHVGRLVLHYPQPDMPDSANASRWDDWLEDFGEIPADILQAACRDWRRSTARFAPSPGQLLEKCVSVEIRRLLRQRADDLLAAL